MQKQVSTEAIYSTPNQPNELLDINLHQFIPRLISGSSAQLEITCHKGPRILGAFLFSGSQISKFTGVVNSISLGTDFHYTINTNEIHSLQALDNDQPADFTTEPYFDVIQTSVAVHVNGATLPFYHPFADHLLRELTAEGLDGLFNFYLNDIPIDALNLTKADALADAFGGGRQTSRLSRTDAGLLALQLGSRLPCADAAGASFTCGPAIRSSAKNVSLRP